VDSGIASSELPQRLKMHLGISMINLFGMKISRSQTGRESRRFNDGLKEMDLQVLKNATNCWIDANSSTTTLLVTK
jgi:hypothetical protein